MAVWSVFILAGCSVLARVAYQVAAHGWIWSGAFGYTADGMQYLGFVREASRHVLIGNPFADQVGQRVFLHPMLAISGGLAWAGLSIPYAFALWVPVGAIALAWGATKVVESSIPTTAAGARITALALALGYAFRPDQLVHINLSLGKQISFSAAQGDAWPMKLLFGWPLGAVSTGLLALVIAGYLKRRGRNETSGPPILLSSGAFLCSWIQPWPGLTIIGAILGAELISRIPGVLSDRTKKPAGWTTPALVMSSAGIPIIYYGLMDRLSAEWHLSGAQLVEMTNGSSWWILWLPLAPLILVAPLAWRSESRDLRLVLLTTWSLAGLLGGTLMLLTGLGNVPQHMLRGLPIPLATLAVIGVAHATHSWPKAARTAISVVALLCLVVAPGLLRISTEQHDTVDPATHRFIQPGESDAFSWISSNPARGDVLAPGSTGAMVPWRTGRVPWVGHRNLTPDYLQRAALQSAFINGVGVGQSAIATRNFVSAHQIAFVLLPCQLPQATRDNLIGRLGPQVTQVIKFGCASVLTLRK